MFGNWQLMINLRIIGFMWLIAGLAPALKHPFNVWEFATHPQYRIGSDPIGVGFWVTQISVEFSFFVIMLIGLGLIRLRRPAVVAGGFLGTISLVVCVWFILTQGVQHGPEPYVAIWCGVALSLYTFFGVWRFMRPSQPPEPLAAPAGGPAAPVGDVCVGEIPPPI